MDALCERMTRMEEALGEWQGEEDIVALWAEHTMGESKCRGVCWRPMTISLRRNL